MILYYVQFFIYKIKISNTKFFKKLNIAVSFSFNTNFLYLLIKITFGTFSAIHSIRLHNASSRSSIVFIDK